MMGIINDIIQISCINLITYFVFIKLLNYKNSNFKSNVIMVMCSIVEAVSLTYLLKVITSLPSIIIIYCIQGINMSLITKIKVKKSVIVTFISLSIVYLIYIMSIVPISIIMKLINKNILKENIIIPILAFIMEYVILHFLFKMKRFKNGIPFLKNEEKVNNIGIIGVIFIGIVLIIYSIIPNTTHTRYIFVGLSIEAICLFIWIKKKITKYYKQKLKEQTVADLQNEIKEKDNKINEILEENKAIATINHKYSSRIKALEEFSSKIVSKPELVEKMKTEFGEDYTAFAAQIKRISQEYSNEMKTKVTKENAIPKTGIFGIDTLLEHMSTEATKSNISLDVKINASINYIW